MIIERLAHYAAEQSKNGLKPEVAHSAKRVLIDWFAALLPGTVVAPATLLRRAHARELGQGDATLPGCGLTAPAGIRSEEHTSELQSLMRISYAVFCLKKKKNTTINN